MPTAAGLELDLPALEQASHCAKVVGHPPVLLQVGLSILETSDPSGLHLRLQRRPRLGREALPPAPARLVFQESRQTAHLISDPPALELALTVAQHRSQGAAAAVGTAFEEAQHLDPIGGRAAAEPSL
jgi:hypothetical protein